MVAATASVPLQVSSSDPEFIPVFALAAFENCPDEVLTDEYANSLRRYLSSEEHLAKTLWSPVSDMNQVELLEMGPSPIQCQ